MTECSFCFIEVIMPKHLSERRTEDIVVDLLDIQGWPTGRPPNGRLIRQNEYKAFSHLADIFKGKSKSGSGDAYPDFLLISDLTQRPQMVIETKADPEEIEVAFDEACSVYGNACRDAGHTVIAVGIAGQDKTGIKVLAATYTGGVWEPLM